jgi:tyrosine-protein kinase Etk/Wzc
MNGEIENLGENKRKERTLAEIFLHYVAIVLRYKWFIIIFTAFCAVGSVTLAIVSLVLPSEISPLPNQFTANALLLFQREDIGLDALRQTMGLETSFPRSNFDYGNLAIRIIHSRSFLDELIEAYNIFEKYGIESRIQLYGREAILNRLMSEYSRTTYELIMLYEDTDPIRAYDILTSIVTQLQDWFFSKLITARTNKKLLYEKKLLELRDEITKLERQILQIQKQYGVLSLDELATQQAEIIGSLQSQLVVKEMEIKNYSQIATTQDPHLSKLKAERDNILDLIEQVEKGLPGYDSALLPKKALPEIALDFSHLQQSLDIQNRIYENLSQQYEIAKLTLEAEPLFQVIEWPEIPKEKSGPKRTLIIAGATVGGFLLSVLLVIVYDLIRKMLNKRKQI